MYEIAFFLQFRNFMIYEWWVTMKCEDIFQGE